MSSESTREAPIDTRPVLLLEAFVLAIPPVLGVGIVGILQQTALPILGPALALFAAWGYATVSICVPVCLYLDARRIRGTTADWRPRPLVYVAVGLLWAPFVGVYYLARRHRHVGTRPVGAHWWPIVAAAPIAALAGFGVAIVGGILGIPGIVPAALGLTAAIGGGAFPVAIYRDAAHVRTHSDRWTPNPGVYLGAAFATLWVPIAQIPLAAYYLTRRQRTVGVP